MGERPRSARRSGTTDRAPRVRLLRRRRPLEVDDVQVVETSRIRTAVGGTVVGNFMEWFDFGVYGYMAITLANLFFQTGNESLDLLLSLLGFAVSFLVRPLGGLILGPLGDRIGRQKVLFFTMAAMAIATALIGLLPTAATIGVWAAFLLYALKMIQGFSTGGEYAGAATYVAEFSSDKRRGFFSSWLDVGSYLGFAAGAGTVALTHTVVSMGWGAGAFDAWGWRIPFLVAIPLGAVAIYFRARIPETPAFEAVEEVAENEELDADDPMVASGLKNLLRHHWKAVLVAVAFVAAGNTTGYALTSYMPTFLGSQLGMNEMMSAAATIPALVVLALSLPFIGRLSDRIGRRNVLWIAIVSTLVLTVPAFLLMLTGHFWLIQLAMFMIAVPTAMYLAMFASTLPAMFPTAVRYAAMGLAFNVSVSLFGGTTPLISQALIDLTGNPLMPAFWIMFFTAVFAIAMRWLDETAGTPLMGSFPTVEEPEEAHELVAGQAENDDLDLTTMPLPEETLVVPVDAGGAPLSGVDPVPADEVPAALVEAAAELPPLTALPDGTLADPSGEPFEGAGEQAHMKEPAPQG
ncbi:MFS transporter [Brachybacterium aquaticum]|uniref:Putative proline/betaine transporter n=1 Tax=Brachybacterium aquaticum TaxID=1432564 RepID=A0A841ABA7_9MICO|nr:MFS transporter [Brachybacterium aquaticum]MBB5830645.1 MHS family proline/betaine transporter-like MFS transporter [Brachybacterium aquaticum]